VNPSSIIKVFLSLLNNKKIKINKRGCLFGNYEKRVKEEEEKKERRELMEKKRKEKKACFDPTKSRKNRL